MMVMNSNCFMKLIVIGVQITNCSTDEHLQSVLQEDAMLHVLQQIHYRGVPSRESLQSAKNILRYAMIKSLKTK